MSLFARRRPPRQERLWGIGGVGELIPARPNGGAGISPEAMTADSAMRHSAVWACLRLRADLISTLPVDVYRKFGGIQIEMPKPPVLVNPGGERVGIIEWLYSTQIDLDRAGNAIGLISERNGLDLPQRIDLQPIGDCSVRVKDGKLTYRIGGKTYQPDQVWHERQFTVGGLPVGLSPVAYGAWSIGQYQSAVQFALDWYLGGGVPKMSLRNVERTIAPEAAAEAKRRYKASIQGRDVFVHGKDWELRPVNAEAVGAAWLESQQASVLDVARFFGVPGDLIDGSVAKSSITYANITQRNLQLLIMNLGPAIVRREAALSSLLPAPRFVKLNSDALLRMDPATQAQMLASQIAARMLTVTEARALLNRAPLTPEQVDEFEELFGAPSGDVEASVDTASVDDQPQQQVEEVAS